MTIEEVQSEIDEFNENAHNYAQEVFTEQIGQEMVLSCNRLVDNAKNCIKAIKSKQPFEPFGCFDSDEIARIYAADMTISYDGYDLNMSNDIPDSDDWEDYAISETCLTEAEESYDRAQFIDTFEKYLRAAAKLAKAIESSAAEPYLGALALSKETKTKFSRLTLSAEEALKLVELEKTATQTLLADLNKSNGKGK